MPSNCPEEQDSSILFGMPPKARICYICGRPTLLPGYQQHVVQCKALFEKREMAKPPKERRPCPRDPMESMGRSGKAGRFEDEAAFNDAAMKSWEQTLLPCQFCGRTFLPEKLPIHNRSCSVSNPSRRISGGLRQQNSGHMSESLEMGEFNIGSAMRTGGFDKSYINPRLSRGDSGIRKQSRGSQEFNGNYMEDFPTYGHLIKCKDCGRNFNEVSYEKHAKVCRKVFQQKRKPYDSAKHRAEGTELAAYQSASSRRNKYGAGSTRSVREQKTGSYTREKTDQYGRKSDVPKWKQESLSFREAVRQAKMVSKAEQHSKLTGIPLHKLLPPPGSDGFGDDYRNPPSDYLQCPHCGRSFNQKAGERHIPQCQNIINKPKRLIRGTGHSAVTHSPQSMSLNSSTRGRYDDHQITNSVKARSSRTMPDYSNAGTSSSRKYGVNDPVRINPSSGYQFRR